MRLIAEYSVVIGPVECDRGKTVTLKEGGPTCPEQLSKVTTEVFGQLLFILSTHLADPESDSFFNMWIAEEWRVNTLEHGNKGNPDKKIEVSLRIDEVADDTARIVFVCLTIADEGDYFDPTKIPDATDEEHVYLQGGRGIQFARGFSSLRYGQSIDIFVDPEKPPKGSTKGKSVQLRWAKFEPKI